MIKTCEEFNSLSDLIGQGHVSSAEQINDLKKFVQNLIARKNVNFFIPGNPKYLNRSGCIERVSEIRPPFEQGLFKVIFLSGDILIFYPGNHISILQD